VNRGPRTKDTADRSTAGGRSPAPATDHEPRAQDHTPGSGSLYVVATPIGNLADTAPRALEVLGEVALVLAEDTRRVRKLLSHFHLHTAVRALHEHNEAREVPGLLALLAAGSNLALVSDAGTPLLADPGYRLVRACRDAGFPVWTVPGPSAVTAALAVAGLPPVPFTFAGFLPARAGVRGSALDALAPLPHTLVLFLSPHRLAGEVAACAAHLGEAREAALLAELTKVHERCERGTLAELAEWAARVQPRGEYTLVVGPPEAVMLAVPSPEAARAALDEAAARGLDRAGALREAARALGLTRRRLYALLTPRDAR
jgi:16S rRNA (cytidine1402-2'-O)-methyltransferase